jgi:acetyl-CoA carboxylase biotin carboxyl carrier protein
MNRGGKPKDVFDLERVRQIIELMEQHDLGEVDLQQGEEKIRLKRGGSPTFAVPPSAPYAPYVGSHAPAPSTASGRSESAGPAESPAGAGTFTINCPMVGTFYSRANPESESFVKVGDVVSEDTVVCIVEAMKVFNEIPAECRGKIVEVLVKDQQAVDFGKPMFRVQPT